MRFGYKTRNKSKIWIEIAENVAVFKNVASKLYQQR